MSGMILPFDGMTPRVDPTAFVAENAVLIALFALGAPLITLFAYGRWNPAWIASAVFALAVIAMYFLFFKSANAAFLTDDRDLVARIPEMLRTWSQWQWFRTALGVVSAISGIAVTRRCGSANRASARAR